MPGAKRPLLAQLYAPLACCAAKCSSGHRSPEDGTQLTGSRYRAIRRQTRFFRFESSGIESYSPGSRWDPLSSGRAVICWLRRRTQVPTFSSSCVPPPCGCP